MCKINYREHRTVVHLSFRSLAHLWSRGRVDLLHNMAMTIKTMKPSLEGYTTFKNISNAQQS